MKTIFQDAHILILDKPAGTPVLPDGWDKDAPYLVKALEEEFEKVWVVHRLDKITSGVMVFARNAESHRALNVQFENHEVEKIYHAIVVGIPRWEEKVARHPLRVNVGHKHRTVVASRDRSGKSSETRFKLLRRGQAYSWVEASPRTGRTHQVRVHAAAVGHPLAGDVLYGASESKIIARPALHAHSLTIIHPTTNERMTFMAEHPNDFAIALKLL
jgi:RluA family pseudouridine synthase